MLGVLVAMACPALAAADGPSEPTVHTLPAERAIVWPLHRAIVAFGHASCGTPAILLGDFVDADVVAGADPVGCRIYLNAASFRKMSRAMVCTLLLHEYGHLAGRRDTDDPRSVMYRYYSRPDRRCLGTGS